MNNFKLKAVKVLGAKYIVNNRTSEVHDVKNLKKMCRVKLMTKTSVLYREKALERREKENPDLDGCRWCNKEKHSK